MIFESPEQNEPLLRALTEAAADSGGGFEVVDFGGALGSVWWQHRVRLSALGLGRWIVVEQPHYVEAGREFAGDILRFEPTLAVATGRSVPSILLFSGVLQYLENPVEMIGRAARLGFAHVIIDRVSLVVAGGTRLMVQHTPSGLGGGNYPCWLFKREDLFAPLLRQYRLHAEWSALDKLARDVSHMGFHFCRRS